MLKDSFERSIDYARISVTDRCNYRCGYCMPAEGVEKKAHSDILSFEALEEIAVSLAALGVKKFRITGGEPLIRRGTVAFLERLSAVRGIETLALTTNGSLLRPLSADLKKAGVSSLNISIDSLNEDRYLEITRGGDLKKTIEGIDAAVSAGFKRIKLNVVLLRDINDGEIEAFIAFASERKISVRFIELMPFAKQAPYANRHYIPADAVISACPMEYRGRDGTEESYVTGDGTAVGLIRAVSKKFCHSCNRIRISADGRLLPCLHDNASYDLKPALSFGRQALMAFIEDCTAKKPEGHRFDQALQSRLMSDIGG